MTNAFIAGRIALLTLAGAVMGAVVGALLTLAGEPEYDEVPGGEPA